ncbi:hypothetical protein HaLaN_28011 [Haematococcus lacustris]|uniref:Uncharacterized protein n=1 Tax=Haematococcus lacustris TaxID=44745 RepID=A0A6A0A9N4_HAELA|nr:hypothetical protein HaLaN_28011 [Haematococcus lacustris]
MDMVHECLPPTLLPGLEGCCLNNGGHTTVPQQAVAAGPWVACLATACSPGRGTPCPWLAELSALATSTAPADAICSPQCAASLPLPLPLPLVGWVGSAACPALVSLAGRGVLGPGSEAAGCGLWGACGGPLPGTTSGPALAGHAAGSRLSAICGSLLLHAQQTAVLAGLLYQVSPMPLVQVAAACSLQLRALCVDAIPTRQPDEQVSLLAAPIQPSPACLGLGQQLLVPGVLKDGHKHGMAALAWAHPWANITESQGGSVGAAGARAVRRALQRLGPGVGGASVACACFLATAQHSATRGLDYLQPSTINTVTSHFDRPRHNAGTQTMWGVAPYLAPLRFPAIPTLLSLFSFRPARRCDGTNRIDG